MPMPMTAFPGDIAVQYNDNGQRVLRFTCHFRHSVERVWQALTDDGQLAIWYPTKVHIQPVTGGTITFAFPGGDPFPGDVLEAAPPHLLVFTTLDDVLRWEIQADGAGSTLVLSNTVANPPHTLTPRPGSTSPSANSPPCSTTAHRQCAVPRCPHPTPSSTTTSPPSTYDRPSVGRAPTVWVLDTVGRTPRPLVLAHA